MISDDDLPKLSEMRGEFDAAQLHTADAELTALRAEIEQLRAELETTRRHWCGSVAEQGDWCD